MRFSLLIVALLSLSASGNQGSDPHAASGREFAPRRPAAVVQANAKCLKKALPTDRGGASYFEGASVVNGTCQEGFASGAENPFPFESLKDCQDAYNRGNCG